MGILQVIMTTSDHWCVAQCRVVQAQLQVHLRDRTMWCSMSALD